MTTPVESHPLSPDEQPTTSRIARQRVSRVIDTDVPRPVTSYFTLKSQSDQRVAASMLNWSPHDLNDPSFNATVKPVSKPKAPSNPFAENPSSSSNLSINGDDTVKEEVKMQKSKIQSSGIREESTPGPTPRAQFLALSEDAGLGVHPEEMAPKVISTKWHVMNDDSMDKRMRHLAQVPDERGATQMAYRSALRILSQQLDTLKTVHAACEKERNNEQLRRRKIASLMKTVPAESVATVRTILDILSEKVVLETPLDGPQLVVSDSLTEAIADAFTPLGVPNDLLPTTPIDNGSRSEDAISVTSSRPERDGIEGASIRSRGSTKSRDSKNRPASVLGDWMGGWWREKNKGDSSARSETSSRDPSPGGEETERNKAPAKGHVKRRTLASFGVPSWMNPTPATVQPDPPAEARSESPERTRESRRRLSIKTTQSGGSTTSPLVAHFQPLPTPILPPMIAPQISTPPSEAPIASSRASIHSIERPPLPSGPHPSHMKAISYATRVMTSDPYSVLDDATHVSPFIAELAHNLITHLKEDKSFQLREGRPGNKSTPQRAATTPTAIDIPVPAVAVGQIETTESRATIVSNLSKTLNNSMLSAMGNRTSAIFTSPILPSFKSRIPATLAEPAKPPPSLPSTTTGIPSVAGATVPKIGTVEMDSIIPVESKPPTLYLSRTYTSSVADPSFRPSVFPSAPSRFTLKASKSSTPLELHTDRFGFIYDAIPYDVNLLANARAANNTAPACLTGVRISDRGADTDDDDWWPTYEGEVPPSKKKELKILPEPCECQDGILPVVSPPKGSEDTAPNTHNIAMVKSKEIEHASSTENVEGESSQKNPPEIQDHPTERTEVAIPNHVCFNTVRVLLSELTSIHDTKQKSLQVEWDALMRRIRRIKDPSKQGAQAVLAQASSGAAAFLGLSKSNEDAEDEESRWTAGLGLSQILTNKDEWKEFSKLIRAGVPLTYRSKIWLECSGALELMEPGTFRDLASEARQIREKMQKGDSKNVPIEEIEKDVTRTMPLNVFFGGDGQGVDKLRAVLGAYSLRNPAVGYCQGMNLVASTLLLVLADQQEAFWVFTAIIERILPPDFFSPSLLVSRACPMVLLDYVQDHLPNLFTHLTNIGIDLPAICFSWFLSLFTDCLPVETLFRIWDLLLCDKNGMDILFRISLAILKIGEEDLLHCQSLSSLYSVLESLPTRMWDADKLLQVEYEFRGTILHDDIVKRRTTHIDALSQRTA